MKLFAGLSRTDYEDVFRAIGALVDERGWTNVSLMEVDEGLVVQAMVKPTLRELRPRLETYLLTDNDLERVMRDAVLRRSKKQGAAPQPASLPVAPAPAPPAPNHVAPPPPSRLVEERLFSMAAARPPLPTTETAAAEPPLPPMPTLDGLPGERPLGLGDQSDALFAGAETPAPPAEREERFTPEPMRLSAVPAAPSIDLGAARAAVVMAHIVAARLKSGMPMTGDDPDLASLLEQVRALDETGIGNH